MKVDALTNQVYVVAVNEARLQGHEFVMPEHFLYSALLFDLGKELVRESGGQVDAIVRDLQQFFERRMPRRVAENPSESYFFVRMFELAGDRALAAGRQTVTLADLLAAIFLLEESFARFYLQKNGMTQLKPRMPAGDAEEAAAPEGSEASDKDAAFLRAYTTDLCEQAARGKLDPLIGRADILERTVLILSRRLKNNPVHVGDPGVGKTAIVEGLAQRVAAGDVPEGLRNARLLRLDMSALLAGTRYRGDFEERLVRLLGIAEKTPNMILYVDEIHTMVGAGAVSGSALDASGIIKPYLARGGLRFIGSTTHEEYKKHFEKDRALARRFAKVDVPEPGEADCLRILQGLRPRFEAFHGVAYPGACLELICRLTARHMTDRRLPDKAIDVMDEAGARARLAAQALPADASSVAANMDGRPDLLQNGSGRDGFDMPQPQKWAASGANQIADAARVSPVPVTRALVEETVASMAQVPPESAEGDDRERLARLEENLNAQVYGQEEAAAAVALAIKSARAGLNEPERPVASLLFVGPTGVGKTEMAKQLAKQLGIGLLRFDMSEYQEKHAVARLIGSPPGYVGYEEGGLLTDAVRRTPHAVLLLDEAEKAHADILNVLLQVMDYGKLTDNAGRPADFSSAVLIMTSNAGAREQTRSVIGFGGGVDEGAAEKAVERIFSPEFRNRLDAVVRFNRVDAGMARRIADKALGRLAEKLKARGVTLVVTESAASRVAEAGLSETYGAREIIRVVENDIKRLLVDGVLFGQTAGGTLTLDVRDGVWEVI